MYKVNEAPSKILESLKMLATFSGSVVVLTVENGGATEYIHSQPEGDKAGDFKDALEAVLGKIVGRVKEKGGWTEIKDSRLVSPFGSARVYNLFISSMARYRFVLLRYAHGQWSHNHDVLMDQTRQIVERQLEYAISETGGENTFLFPDDNTYGEVTTLPFCERGVHVNKGLTYDGDNSLQLLLDHAPAGVFFYSTSLSITFVNKHFINFFGATEKQLLNFNLANLRDKSIMPAIKTPLSGKEGYYEGAYRSTTGGDLVNIILKTAPIMNNSGEITGIMGIVQDNTELLKTLGALEESKNSSRLLINATPDIICFKDEKGQWMEANDAIQELFRLKGKDFLFKSESYLKTLVPELAGVFEQCKQSDQLAWQKGEPVMVEELIPLPNGDERRMDVIKTPVFGERGERKGIVILGRDITARKIAEEMLRDSEERFRVVATRANDIIFEWNPVSDKIEWFGKIGYIGDTGIPPRIFSEFIARIHPDDQERVAHFWKKRFPLKEEWHDEFRVKLRSGAMKHYRASGIMVFKDGKPGKALGTFTDVTQEKELINNLRDAVEEAQRNQSRITGLLSVIPDLMFVFDRNGVFIDYHAESEQSLYSTPELFIDRVVDDVLPPDVAALTHEKIDMVRHHQGIETYEYTLSVNDEHEIYESRMVFVEEDRILTIVRDVTHARKVEKELIEAKEQAEKSDRLKSAFLANMSHEIRTPMNGILGFSELLRSGGMDERERENCIDVIVKSGQQLLSIINDVLEVSQLETGQVLVYLERVNLNRLISDLANFFKIEAIEKSIELSFQVPQDEVFCTVDGGKVTQIFNNLLSNALKFTSPGGHIIFGFDVEDNLVRFFVHDDGVGIAPRNHDLIFERFGQVLKVGALNKGGTGLGLSICKSLAELMGGEIWVESVSGQGASFFFTIPKN